MSEYDLPSKYDKLAYLSGLSRPWLYISGPMTGRNGQSPYVNCRDGILLAQEAWHKGWHPVCPMLNSLWEMVAGPLDSKSGDGASGWMDLDISSLTRCDAIFRLPGVSPGADREVALMMKQRKMVLEGFLPTAKEAMTFTYDAILDTMNWRKK